MKKVEGLRAIVCTIFAKCSKKRDFGENSDVIWGGTFLIGLMHNMLIFLGD